MDSLALSILLIVADDQLANQLSGMLQLSVSAVEDPFMVKTAVSIPQVVEKEITSPDVVMIQVDDELAITAVASQFPNTPLILITDEDDKQNASWMQLPTVMDIIEQKHLSAALLKRVLLYAHQMWQHIAIKNKAREHRQTAEALLQAGVEMNAILEYEELLDGILQQVAKFFPYDMATIQLMKGEQVQIERIRAENVDESLLWMMEKASFTVFSLQEMRNLREIVENGRSLVIPNTDNYPGWVHNSGDYRIGSWMGVPLIEQDRVIGILSLDSIQPDIYKNEDGQMLESFAKQASLALRNAYIYQGRQREIAELSALYAISQAGTEAVTVDDLLTRCTQIVVEKLYPDCFGFILINDDDATMRIHHAVHERLSSVNPKKFPLGAGVVGQVIESGQLRRIADVGSEPEYERFAAHTHSELCVPLQVGEQIIGAINTESILFDAFTEADERFLVALSQQVATGIERIQLLEAEQRNREEADKLHDAAAFLTTSLDLKQVFDNILSGLEEVVPHDSASVMLLHEEELVIAAARGFSDSNNLVGQSFLASDLLFAEVCRTKRPLYLENAQQDLRFTSLNTNNHIRSWICLPLIVREQVLGALTIDNEQEGIYGDVEVQLAQAFANQAAVAIDNARLYAAEQQARKRAEIMREASSMMVQTLDMDTILDTLLDYLHKLVPFDSASVLFVEGDFAQIHLAKGTEDWTNVEALKQVRINVNTNGTFQEIMRTRRGLLISDVNNDSRWETFELSRYVRSWIGVPIIASGQFLGCFAMDKAIPGYFKEMHLNLIEGFTSQAAILIQNAQLFQETRKRAVELERITALSSALRETVELDRVLEVVLKNVMQLVNGTLGGIYLIDSESGELVLRAMKPSKVKLLGLKQSIGKGIAGFVAQTGRIYIAPDFKSDPLISSATPEESFLLDLLHTSINLPLWVQERVVGVLYIGLDHEYTFSDTEVQLLTAVAEIAGTAIDRAIVLNTLEQRIVARTRELAKANERLTELDRLKTKFVSDVSHELRTPITNLSLYLDLLTRGKPERREQYAAVLRQQVNRLTVIIEDILNISRLDMGKIKLNVLPLNVNRVVQQLVGQFEDKIGENVTLFAEVYQDMPFILGDEMQITQILTNMLSNAVGYTQNGSIRITTSWDDAQKRACIEMKDTGMGIPSQELDHVFERFYRASNVSQSTMFGTGLGLSLVKELVDLHNGEIEIVSEINTGTIVSLYLPISPRLATTT